MLSDLIQITSSHCPPLPQDCESTAKGHHLDLCHSCTALPDILNRAFSKQDRCFCCQQSIDVILPQIIFRGKNHTTWIIIFPLPRLHTNSLGKTPVATSPNVLRYTNYTHMPISINEIWEYQQQLHGGNIQFISEAVARLHCLSIPGPNTDVSVFTRYQSDCNIHYPFT